VLTQVTKHRDHYYYPLSDVVFTVGDTTTLYKQQWCWGEEGQYVCSFVGYIVAYTLMFRLFNKLLETVKNRWLTETGEVSVEITFRPISQSKPYQSKYTLSVNAIRISRSNPYQLKWLLSVKVPLSVKIILIYWSNHYQSNKSLSVLSNQSKYNPYQSK